MAYPHVTIIIELHHESCDYINIDAKHMVFHVIHIIEINFIIRELDFSRDRIEIKL